MSENTQDKKVVVVANLKSPVVGFVLALFLGWLGVDRFYKGGILSILLGIVKLILGVIFFFGFAILSILANASDGVMYFLIGYIIWYILDLIFVPLGISLDNRKKLAMAQGGNQAHEKIAAKSVGKSVLHIIIGVAVAIGIFASGFYLIVFFLS